MRTLLVKVQIGIIVTAALAAAWPAVARAGDWVHDWQALLALLVAASLEGLKVDVTVGRGQRLSISPGLLGAFCVLALYGVQWALWVGVLQTLLNAALTRPRWFKVLFNLGSIGLSTLAAGFVYHQLPLAAPGLPPGLTAVLSVAVYFLLNLGGVSVALAVASRRPFLHIARHNFAWSAIQQGMLGLTGLGLAEALQAGTWLALTLLAPLFMLRFTYQIYARAHAEHMRDLEVVAEDLINTLAAVVESRDAYTFGHSFRVAKFAEAIARRLGYDPVALNQLRRSALLHDIGKIGVPERVLFKPARLTEEEFSLMKRHPEIGYQILRRIGTLATVAESVWQHHERVDGHGYPLGLAGDNITRDARIINVADALDTMISDRPYRPGRPLAEALKEIDRCAGSQFDTTVVHALHAVVAEEGSAFFNTEAEAAPGQVAATLARSVPDLFALWTPV